MKKTLTFRILGTLFFYIFLICLWQVCYFLLAEKLNIIKAYIFPSPKGIIHSFTNLMENNILINALIESFKKIIVGFSISIILGMILGLLLYKFKFISRTMKPLFLGLQTLPSICFIPFSILWFGLSESAIIFVIVIGSVFSITLSINSSMKNISPIFIHVAKTMGAKRANLFFKVILPASIPEFVSGIKHAWSFAWRALIAGEMISGVLGGLGYILLIGRELLDINQIFVIILIIISISVLVEKLIFGIIEKKVRDKMGLHN